MSSVAQPTTSQQPLSTLTLTPPGLVAALSSAAASPAALRAAAPSPFEPGSRWFSLVLTALVIGSLVVLAVAFFVLKRACIGGSDRGRRRRRWRPSAKDDEAALVMPWETAALERQHSAASSVGGGASMHDDMRPVDFDANPVTMGYRPAGPSATGWYDPFRAYGPSSSSSAAVDLRAFPHPPVASHRAPSSRAPPADPWLANRQPAPFDPDAEDVVLPPSQAVLRAAAIDQQQGGGQYRPGEF